MSGFAPRERSFVSFYIFNRKFCDILGDMACLPSRRVLWLSFASALACGPEPAAETTGTTGDPPATSAPDPGTGATASATGGTTIDDATTGTATTSPTTNPTTGVLSTSDSGDTTGSFILTPDLGPEVCSGIAGNGNKECDPWSQDCPPDSKCTPSAGGCDTFQGNICTELPRQPVAVGGACVSEDGPLSGRNDCDVGATCWFVDPDALTGTCVGLCKGSPDAPDCSHVPDSACVFAHGSGAAPLCLPTCHPFVPTCPSGHHCHPSPGEADPFACAPDGPDPLGAVFEACGGTACAEGLLCHEAAATAVECEPDGDCCTPVCDLDAPVCPGLGQTCLPYWPVGQAPPGFDKVGRCGLP